MGFGLHPAYPDPSAMGDRKQTLEELQSQFLAKLSKDITDGFSAVEATRIVELFSSEDDAKVRVLPRVIIVIRATRAARLMNVGSARYESSIPL